MRMLSPTTDWSWPRHNLSSIRLGDVFEDFDAVIESFLRPAYARTQNFQPSCDVRENKDHYLVSFDMPGMKKEDIKIEIEGNRLMISGERRHETKEQVDLEVLHYERMYGKFERTFILPDSVSADKIEAQYENGVLNVALPKAETAKARSIEIQSGPGGFFQKLLGPKKEEPKALNDVKVS